MNAWTLIHAVKKNSACLIGNKLTSVKGLHETLFGFHAGKWLFSDDNDLSVKCSEVRSFFIHRNYPVHVIDWCRHSKVSTIDRVTALNSCTRASNYRIPFTLTCQTYCHSQFFFASIWSSHLCYFFLTAHTFSFKRDRNLRIFLVKGALPSDKNLALFVVLVSVVFLVTSLFLTLQLSVLNPPSISQTTLP